MTAPTLDAAVFQRRARNLFDYWKSTSDVEFGGAECILVPVGTSEEGGGAYMKGVSLQNYLLAFEFPDTVLAFDRSARKMYAYCGQKKATLLEQLNATDAAAGAITVETFVKAKNATDGDSAAVLERFLEKAVGGKTKVGHFPKDSYTGTFITQWESAYEPHRTSHTQIDVSPAVATVLALKDDAELATMRLAARASAAYMSKYFVDEMAAIVDEERVVTHEKLAEKVEAALFDGKARAKMLPAEMDADYVDWCYTPIIQSGGVYDLKPSAQSNADKLHGGTILCSLGVRYKNYCSNVGRTYLIDPTKKQQANYEFLLEVEKHVLAQLKDGAIAKDIYSSTVAYVTEKRPDLAPHLTLKNVGFVTGIEFRESAFVLGGKCTRELFKGMTVNVAVGFAGLVNEEVKEGGKGRTYALMVQDTCVVGETGASVMTGDASREFSEISFFFKSDSDAEKAGDSDSDKIEEVKPTRSTILNTKSRAEARDHEMSAEQKRAVHQRNLMEQRRLESLQRFSGSTPQALADKQVFRRFESYKNPSMLPKEIRTNKILVDRKNDTILLPVFGHAVPFHINTLKNISKNEEGSYVYLRLNFNTPGQVVKKGEPLPFDDATATFVRSFIFRSADTWRYNQLFKDISEMKREIVKKESQRKEMEDLVEQAKLVEARSRIGLLPDVNIRPALEGKKMGGGDVQIHTNGLRYQPIRGDQKIDILFSNIKHLFFQPCDGELLVIIHVHLKNPIMVGKKKTYDVQFTREASESAFEDTSNRRRRHNYGDEDELMAEQEERRRRAKANKEFKLFAEKITEASNGLVDADMPVRELGFVGVPTRSSVLLQPTTNCLVQLSEPPFLVLDLAEIELAYLERIQFTIKNFDIVFVYKDFTKAPLHVNTIPMKSLEAVKDWLDSMDICYVEGPTNLNWTSIMKNVNEDPAGFFEDGGWSQFYSDNEGGSDGSSEEESASEFELSDEDEDEESTESDYSDDGEDESESAAGSDDEDEESGEDWDELERKARREDEKRAAGERAGASSKRRDDDSDDGTRPKKKKR